MRSPLDLIEARLQSFIESSLNFLPGYPSQIALAHQLATAIQQAVAQEPTGVLTSTHQFIVRLHPNSLAIWESRPGLIESLILVLNEAAREAGIESFSPLSLQLHADPTLSDRDFAIQNFSHNLSLQDAGVTGVMPVQGEHPPQVPQLNNAYLVLNGSNTLPLRLSVINLGRRQDNQIVIDDPRVSRSHAQLRAIRGHYVLFDLDSTGGTFINGVQIIQQALKPGDVISLAGVQLIYGEEQLTSKGSPQKLQTGRLHIRHDPPVH